MRIDIIHVNFNIKNFFLVALKIYITFGLLHPEWAIISHLGDWSQPVIQRTTFHANGPEPLEQSMDNYNLILNAVCDVIIKYSPGILRILPWPCT